MCQTLNAEKKVAAKEKNEWILFYFKIEGFDGDFSLFGLSKEAKVIIFMPLCRLREG